MIILYFILAFFLCHHQFVPLTWGVCLKYLFVIKIKFENWYLYASWVRTSIDSISCPRKSFFFNLFIIYIKITFFNLGDMVSLNLNVFFSKKNEISHCILVFSHLRMFRCSGCTFLMFSCGEGGASWLILVTIKYF
jgi:hypothetical protein